MAALSDSVPPRRSSARLVLASALVSVACAAALLATSPRLPMSWDEGSAIWRSRGIRRWAELLLSKDPRQQPLPPLGREGIAKYWPYTTQIEGHPALYGIVIAAGQSISDGWLRPLDSARFGPIVLFAVAAGVMFYRIARDGSLLAASAAVAALMLLPRMFAHAHFASFDGPLVSCWILAWAAFTPARERWPLSALFGIALGMTFSAKATGWFAPLPFVAWTLVYRDRAGAKALALALPLALGTFCLLNPPLWHQPVQGWITFVQMNLNRGEFNIATQFLGRMYNLDHPLPWYNTLVWTGITVPVGILALMIVGLVVALGRWRRDRAGTLLVANAMVLLVVRALPGAPPHDGVRLFLPAFAFLAALAGLGAAAVVSFAQRRAVAGVRPRWVAVGGLLLLYAGSATSLGWYAPQWLSYYNLLIGGLPGATALGMEPTYYWDGLDRSVLDWLDQKTPNEQTVLFAAPSTENLDLMCAWGVIPAKLHPGASGTYRWYVLQHRPSAWQPPDHWLIAHAEPAYRKVIRRGGIGPWRLDQVPVVEVYAHRDYLRACEATGTPPPVSSRRGQPRR